MFPSEGYPFVSFVGAVTVSETDVPETDAPETDVPETDGVETDAPETAVPETEEGGDGGRPRWMSPRRKVFFLNIVESFSGTNV